MATSQRQSTSPERVDPHSELCSAPWFLNPWRSNAGLALAEPGYLSASIFESWFDDPNLGGARPLGRQHENIDLPSFCPPWQSVASMTGPVAHRPQCFDVDTTGTPAMIQRINPSVFTRTPAHQQQRNADPRVPTSNRSLNNFEASLLFDPIGYTDLANFTGLVQREYLSSAAEKTSDLSLVNKEMGGE